MAIHEITEQVEGPLAGRSVSPATIDEESDAATGSTMLRLMGVALLVIAALTFLFMRSPSDVLFTLAGLLVTIVWITGAQGWLGPNALGWIGPPNILTTMAPIMLIGLAVDYAIQTVALYREQRGAGEAVGRAVRRGLRTATIPLALAAGTTVASFLTNLASPIPANGDFGVTAGLGVASGFVVMLTLIPAGRALIDRRREERGSLPTVRPISKALPGVGGTLEALGRELARRPAPYLGVVAVVTVLLGLAATRIDSPFDTRDFLPSGGDATADLETLDAAFGGSTEAVNVLIEAEVTQARTILNLLDFTDAFQDDLRWPVGSGGRHPGLAGASGARLGHGQRGAGRQVRPGAGDALRGGLGGRTSRPPAGAGVPRPAGRERPRDRPPGAGEQPGRDGLTADPVSGADGQPGAHSGHAGGHQRALVRG